MLLFSRLDNVVTPDPPSQPNRQFARNQALQQTSTYQFTEPTKSVMRYYPQEQSRFHLTDETKYQFQNPSSTWVLDPQTMTYTYQPPSKQVPKVVHTAPVQSSIYMRSPSAPKTPMQNKQVQTYVERDYLQLETSQNLSQPFEFSRQEDSKSNDLRASNSVPEFYFSPIAATENHLPTIKELPSSRVRSPDLTNYLDMNHLEPVNYEPVPQPPLQPGSDYPEPLTPQLEPYTNQWEPLNNNLETLQEPFIIDKNEEENFAQLQETKHIPSRIFTHWISSSDRRETVSAKHLVDSEMQTDVYNGFQQHNEKDTEQTWRSQPITPQVTKRSQKPIFYQPIIIIDRSREDLFKRQQSTTPQPPPQTQVPIKTQPDAPTVVEPLSQSYPYRSNNKIFKPLIIQSSPIFSQLPRKLEEFTPKKEEPVQVEQVPNIIVTSPPNDFQYEYCNNCEQFVNKNKVDSHSKICFNKLLRKQYQTRSLKDINTSLQKLLYLFDQQLRLFEIASNAHEKYEIYCYKARQIIYGCVYNDSNRSLIKTSMHDLAPLAECMQNPPFGAESLLLIFNKLHTELLNKKEYMDKEK